MIDTSETRDGVSSTGAAVRSIVVLALLLSGLYVAIAHLSQHFAYESVTVDRPIVVVLLLFIVAFVAYFVAIRQACKAPQDSKLVGLILVTSLAFRLILLGSLPIQEVDVYRYLWDGAVTATGVSPFRFSPAEVRAATPAVRVAPDLRRILALRDQQPALDEILGRVQYGDLPTVYPPVSQAIFALAYLTTPTYSSVPFRVIIIKAWLIAFDFGTLLLVIALLRRCQQPVGMCIVYGWCPLVLKEVANSGHLDAVAVFFATLAVYLAMPIRADQNHEGQPVNQAVMRSSVAAIVLGFGVGAKLWPMILAPLFLVTSSRRAGWRRALIPAAVFTVTVLTVLWPMLPQSQNSSDLASVAQQSSTGVSTKQTSPQLPPTVAPVQDPSRGMRMFLRHWEMNDFIFLLLIENLRPNADTPSEYIAWFSFLPESSRVDIANRLARRAEVGSRELAFLVARAITAVAFVGIATYLMRRSAHCQDDQFFCEAAFLTIAWFWLLCPTQNPWYWTWAVPLVPFARNRAWLAVSGLVMMYYLRFWFIYHWPETPVWGTRYLGAEFFDFVVVWVEFAPWLIVLTTNGNWIRRNRAVAYRATLTRGPQVP